MKIYLYAVLLSSLFLLLIENSFALDQNEKLWLAVNAQQTLSKDKKWLSFLYSQFRFIDKDHPWEAVLFEGGIGYRLINHDSIWFGYRWVGRNPNNGFFQENRLFQQYILQLKPHEFYQIISRARLEEIERSNQNQIALRLRLRFATEIKKSLFFSNVFPFVYDEVFLQLNNTDYTPHPLFSENRLFLGFNLHMSKKTWWEIGYINQFQKKTPLQNQNSMSHIASITYSFS